MTTTIIFEPPAAFLNSNVSLHWRKKSDLVKKWRAAACAAIEASFEPHHYTKAHIVFSIRWPDNVRRDPANWYPTAKACVDGLVDANLLPDDDGDHLVGPDMRREYPNGSPRVTVTITPLEESHAAR